MEHWWLAALAAFLAGVAKAGVPGLGILVVPLMVFAVGDARSSVALLVIILVAADICALIAHKAVADWRLLRRLVPWVGLGMVIGLAILAVVPAGSNVLFAAGLGWLVLAMILVQILRKRQVIPTPHGSAVFGTGFMTGVATTVANAAGPLMQLYLAGLGLRKEAVIGTLAWFFFMVNLSKIPLYFALGSVIPGQPPLLTLDGVSQVAPVLPVVVVGAWLGFWLQKFLSEVWFHRIILIGAGFGGARLALLPWW
jgi:uncharacterized membrane protein YfcA